MSEIKITYEEALAQYPNEVAKALADINPKHQAAKQRPQDLKWVISWCTRFSGNGPSRREARLGGTFKGWGGWAKFNKLPKHVTDIGDEQARKDRAEKARIAKLSPSERDSEIEECLAKLRGTPGFVEVRLNIIE